MVLEESEEEYTQLYTNGRLINNHIYSLILYNCCFSNTVKLKLGYDLKILLIVMQLTAEKMGAEYIFRLAKIVATSLVQAWNAQMLNIIYMCWNVRRSMKELNKEDGGEELDSRIDVSYDWNNRIDYIPDIYICFNEFRENN